MEGQSPGQSAGDNSQVPHVKYNKNILEYIYVSKSFSFTVHIIYIRLVVSHYPEEWKFSLPLC